MPPQATGGITSPNIAQAKTAANGGTRKNNADTRDTSPARIIANNNPMLTIELLMIK